LIDSPLESEEACAEFLRRLILQDPTRLNMLQVAESLVAEQGLPDALLAAGFVRNCVWDYLHQLSPTPLSDVDLIYFDAGHQNVERDVALEACLRSKKPIVCWDVKNQARMGQCNCDPDYTSSLDAMRYWPEQQTAVGIRLDGSREVVSSFGLVCLFSAELNVGPFRSESLLFKRALKKGWFQRWPRLHLVVC